jgi:hypothetical protein
MNSHDEKQLEQFIHRTLRSLPERRAPRSLEQRVLAALESRGAVAWWHKSYAHWPMPVRAGFVVLSALAAALIIWGLFLGRTQTSRVTADLAQQFAWVTAFRGIAGDIGGAFTTAFRALPPLWLYGGLAAVATGYVALLGMGAAAYRAFFVRR